MKKSIFLLAGLFILSIALIYNRPSTNQPQTPTLENPMPAPTGGQTKLYEGQMEGEGRFRRAYEKAIHKTHDKADWQTIDMNHRMKLYKQKKALKKSGLAKSNSYANGNLDGSWVERGSNNNAGNLTQIEYIQNGDVLFGISGGGTIWKGNLDGTDWTPQNEDLQFGGSVFKVIPNGNGGYRLLATLNKIIWYSDNEGLTWTTSSGISFYDNWGSSQDLIALNDANNSVYYLTKAWSTSPWGAVTRLYYSDDRGETFSQVIQYQQGSADRIDLWTPENSDKGYLIVNGADLYELEGMNLNLINSNDDLPTNQATVLTGTETGSGIVFYTLMNGNTVYKSSDNGANWTQMGTTPASAWGVGMTASPNAPTHLFMGAVECFRSYDSGATWTKVNSWGAYYSNTDLLHADIMDFTHGEKSDGTDFILVGNHGGLHISYDDLQTTTNLGAAGLNISQYYGVRTDPNSNAFLYAGAQDQGHQRSGDGNNSGIIDFEQVVSGDYGSSVFSENGTRFWTVYPGAMIHYYPNPQTEVKKAQFPIGGNHKAGNGWIIPTAAVADPAENAIFIGGGNINGGNGSHLVKLTATSQAPWSISASQYSYDFRANSSSGTATISAINASTVDANRLYVGMSDGSFFYSNDNGSNWSQASAFSGPTQGWSSTMAIYSSKTTSNEVWFAGNGYSTPAIYQSTDGGQTFTAKTNGLPNTLVRDITANTDESLFFAATDIGPFVYVVADDMWYEFMGTEAPQQSYRSVEYVPSISTVRFATYGRGIWDFEINCNQNTYYADLDGDGYGDPNNSVLACAEPPSFTSDNSDCYDLSAAVYPNATEICDGLDNNCDGQIDEGFTTSCGDYCAPSHWGSQNELITKVTLNTIDNVSSGWTNGTGYSDFTNISTDLTANSTYTITVTTNYGWAASKMGIWIDFNKNIQFDANEAIATFSGNGPHSATFSVPSTAFNGMTRLRVRYQYGSSYTPAPCAGSGYSGGETEDYTVNIINCTMNTYYADNDGDGYGDLDNPTQACSAPTGYVSDNSDCDDDDPNVPATTNCLTPVVMENGTLNSVNETWQVVDLQNTYTSPVIVATPKLLSKSDAPVVTRIRNANSTSFEVKIQNPSGTVTSSYEVHYFVVEEGTYDAANNGIDMEAKTVLSTKTAKKKNWVTETRTYANSYTNPVVLGQVMTYNDSNWSTFWACGNSRTSPPTASVFKAGKHVGEDTNSTRSDETIGYIVLEEGTYAMGDLNFETALGADLVKGPNNTGYNYTLNMSTPESAVLSAAALDGGDGGFPVLFGSNPFGSSKMTMAFDEDQIVDSERNHTTEQVAYIVFGQNNPNPINIVENDDEVQHPENDKFASGNQLSDLTVFPNPAKNWVKVQANVASNESAQIILSDLKGRVVFEQLKVAVFGNQLEVEMEVSQLENGIYFVTILSGEERIVKRLLKVD